MDKLLLIAAVSALALFPQSAALAQVDGQMDSIAYKEFAMGPPQVVMGDNGGASSFSLSVGPDPYIPLGMVVPPAPGPLFGPPGPGFGPGPGPGFGPGPGPGFGSGPGPGPGFGPGGPPPPPPPGP